MTNEEIKKAIEEYFNQMLAKNADYLDHVTDSWIYDAESWFLTQLERQGFKLFTNSTGLKLDYTQEVEEIVKNFWKIALKKKEELYDEKYGERDAKYCLYRIKNDVKTLFENYNSIKHYFKKFNAYTEAVTYQFEDLVKYLQLLNDIENDKVESLKEKEE